MIRSTARLAEDQVVWLSTFGADEVVRSSGFYKGVSLSQPRVESSRSRGRLTDPFKINLALFRPGKGSRGDAPRRQGQGTARIWSCLCAQATRRPNVARHSTLDGQLVPVCQPGTTERRDGVESRWAEHG